MRPSLAGVKQDEPLTEERIREEKIRSRLEVRALLESGAVTPEELQRRNSLFTREEIARSHFDFVKWRKDLAKIHAGPTPRLPPRAEVRAAGRRTGPGCRVVDLLKV